MGSAATLDCCDVVEDDDALDGVVFPVVGGVVVALFHLFADDAGGVDHDAADCRAGGEVGGEGAVFTFSPVGDGVADADCVDVKFFCAVAVVA